VRCGRAHLRVAELTLQKAPFSSPLARHMSAFVATQFAACLLPYQPHIADHDTLVQRSKTGLVEPNGNGLLGEKSSGNNGAATQLDARVAEGGRPESLDLLKVAPSHPRVSVLRGVNEKQSFLRRTVSDFTCRLVKRERFDGGRVGTARAWA
jgi:hypothetical protein